MYGPIIPLLEGMGSPTPHPGSRRSPVNHPCQSVNSESQNVMPGLRTLCSTVGLRSTPSLNTSVTRQGTSAFVSLCLPPTFPAD